MGLGFELVGERVELRRLAVAIREGLCEQPVGEPGIPGQKRAVEVRAQGTPDAATLSAALAVIPEPGHDAAERLGTRIQVRAAGVVFEARQCAVHTGLELALE